MRNRLTQARFETSIETCTLKGTEPTVVVADPLLRSFCWAAQGCIIYAREDSVSPDSGNLWKIPLNSRTGKAESRPTRLTNWAGFYVDDLAVSADGKRMTYKRSTKQIQIYVGELEAGGTSLKSPKRLTLDEAWNVSIGWTADSQDVLFLFGSLSGAQGYTDRPSTGVRPGLSSAIARLVVGSGSVSPDGSWLLYAVAPQEDCTSSLFRVMRVPIDGGPSQFVLEGKNMPNRGLHCTEAPATFCAVGELSPDRKLLTITSFDPLKGRGRILKTIETDPTAEYDWALIPDGSKLAFIRRGEREAHIRLFSLTGGKDREISVKGWGNLQNLEYSRWESLLLRQRITRRCDPAPHRHGRPRAGPMAAKGPISNLGGAFTGRTAPRFFGVFQNSNLWMVEGF